MIWSKPCCRRSSTRNSITGLLMMGIIGLGTESVMGRTRLPLPAASMVALRALGIALDGFLHGEIAGEDPVQADDLQQRHHRRLDVRETDVAPLRRAAHGARARPPTAV